MTDTALNLVITAEDNTSRGLDSLVDALSDLESTMENLEDTMIDTFKASQSRDVEKLTDSISKTSKVGKALRANLQRLRTTLSRMGRAFKTAAGHALRFGVNLAKIGFRFIISGIKAIGIAALAAGAALVGLAVGMGKLAEEGFNLRIVEDAFMAMGEGMGVMLKQMKHASLGMISNTDLMMAYNDAALLVSKTFANELPVALEYIAKIAAATGQDINFLLQSWVTGIGRKSPMILDNAKIYMGTMEDVFRRWAEANKEVAASYVDHTAAISKSTSKIDDLKKSLELAILKQSEFTEKTSASTRQSNLNRIEKLKEQIAAVTGEVSDLADTTGSFTDDEIRQMIDGMTDAEQTAILYADGLAALKRKAAGLPDIVNPMQQMKISVENFGDSFKKTMSRVLEPWLERIAPKVEKFFDIFGRIISGDTFEDTFADLAALPVPLQWVINLTKGLFDVLEAFSTGGFERGIGMIGFQIERMFGKKAYEHFVRFKDGLSNLGEALDLKKLFEDPSGWLEDMKLKLKTKWEEMLAELKRRALIKWEEIKADAIEQWEGIKENLIRKWDELIAALMLKYEELKTKLLNKLEEMKLAANEIDWYDVGVSIGKGIMKGFIAISKSLGELIVGTITGILVEAANALGIKSPSKEFEKLGALSMQGFQQGLMGGAAGIGKSFGGTAPQRSAMAAAPIGGGSVVIHMNAPVIGFGDKYQLADELGGIIDLHTRRSRG